MVEKRDDVFVNIFLFEMAKIVTNHSDSVGGDTNISGSSHFTFGDSEFGMSTEDVWVKGGEFAEFGTIGEIVTELK